MKMTNEEKQAFFACYINQQVAVEKANPIYPMKILGISDEGLKLFDKGI